ncbi:hypothetical protein [Paraburkholderia tropica]|uniref:hypothetical protein n=1 Tax=Paraburkholderia tropica TaxID=92647 RepID=UPI001F2E6EBB|nr:hypothetical protein [Paraburkholderia tropica]
MKTNYAEFDAAVLNRISDKPKTFTELFDSPIQRACEEIANEPNARRPATYGASPYRILDRRLQALRKRGLIEWTTKGWVRVPAA